MPLTIVPTTVAGTAYLIPQRFTVRTINGRAVGTAGLMGCMGVVIHSPQYQIGCLAHIEAQTHLPTYLQVFQTYVIYMLSKIRKYGGVDHGLQVGLFGNAGGSLDLTFTDGLRTTLVMAGIPTNQISDERNHAPQGPNYNAGAAARQNNGTYGHIIYLPSTSTVHMYPLALNFTLTNSTNTSGIRREQLQF